MPEATPETQTDANVTIERPSLGAAGHVNFNASQFLGMGFQAKPLQGPPTSGAFAKLQVKPLRPLVKIPPVVQTAPVSSYAAAPTTKAGVPVLVSEGSLKPLPPVSLKLDPPSLQTRVPERVLKPLVPVAETFKMSCVPPVVAAAEVPSEVPAPAEHEAQTEVQTEAQPDVEIDEEAVPAEVAEAAEATPVGGSAPVEEQQTPAAEEFAEAVEEEVAEEKKEEAKEAEKKEE